MSEAEGLLRRHLGVVFDIGHQSVGFEDIGASLTQLVDAGIPIFKLQEAAALWVEHLTLEQVPALREFTDTIYLSQTTMRRDGEEPVKYLNLGEALDAFETDPRPAEIRTHFHVPVFLEELGPFRTTRFAVQDALRMHRRDAALGPPRDRDLHLGRAAGAPQDRRHHRLRLPRAGVRARRAGRLR